MPKEYKIKQNYFKIFMKENKVDFKLLLSFSAEDYFQQSKHDMN